MNDAINIKRTITEYPEGIPLTLNVGDIVSIEQCWEDEAGNYHDESGEVLAIKEDGSLVLDFRNVPDEVKAYLKEQEFHIADTDCF